jgi:predicted RNase H-like nuclease (RuvC/YqgF family)
MSDTTKVCKHGQLARSCEICDRDTTITELRAKLTEAEAEVERLQKLVGEIRTSRDKVGFQNDVLTAEVERLTKHVENLTSIKDDAIHVGEGLVARIKELEAERETTKAREAEFINDLCRLDAKLSAVVAEESAPKWISVSERLPETNGDYLAVYQSEGFPSGKPYKRVAILLFTQGLYWSCSSLERVTHWMPLPPAPKEEAKSL